MSQSLHAIKRFRLRELVVPSPKARTLPAAASAPNRPQRPLATPTPLAAAPTEQPSSSSSSSRSGSDDTPTITGAAGAVLDNPFVPHKNPKSGRWAPPKYSLRRQADLIKHARKSGTLHLLPPGPKLSEAQLQFLASASAAAPTTTTTTTTTTVTPHFALSVATEQQEEEEEGRRRGLVGVRMGQEEEETRRGRGEDGPAPAPAPAAWTRSVEWVGTVRERNVEGADVGNRLYAGKKRMFKGHKWERERERRVARTKMLLRDMDKRVQRFKGVRSLLFPFPFLSRTQLLFLVFFISFLFFFLFFSFFGDWGKDNQIIYHTENLVYSRGQSNTSIWTQSLSPANTHNNDMEFKYKC